jgi:hypothetical protein
VLTGDATVDQLERKGYTAIKAPENIVSAASRYGVQSAASVLSADELSGREITDPSPDSTYAVEFIWETIESHGLTNGKEKPPVKGFTSILDAGVMLNGYYRDGVVYINEDLGGSASEFGGRAALSDRLLKVALEEVVHYVTGATDNSRDFQDYLLDLAVKLSRTRINEEMTA